MTPSSVDIFQLAFSSVFVTSKGSKQLPALYENGEPVAFQTDEFLEIPFEPSAFNDSEANRVTLYMSDSFPLSMWTNCGFRRMVHQNALRKPD